VGEYLTKLHAPEHTRVRASTITVQDLDSKELDLLGNAKSLAPDGAGYVGTVAIFVRVLRRM
jgi:hypothetical protein